MNSAVVKMQFARRPALTWVERKKLVDGWLVSNERVEQYATRCGVDAETVYTCAREFGVQWNPNFNQALGRVRTRLSKLSARRLVYRWITNLQTANPLRLTEFCAQHGISRCAFRDHIRRIIHIEATPMTCLYYAKERLGRAMAPKMSVAPKVAFSGKTPKPPITSVLKSDGTLSVSGRFSLETLDHLEAMHMNALMLVRALKATVTNTGVKYD